MDLTKPVKECLVVNHYLLTCKIKFKSQKLPTKMVTHRILKDINYDLFKDDLIKSDLCSNPPEDINFLVTEYNQCLRELLDKHAPLPTRNN